jgi:diacylglycerol kinase family enzyme
VKFLLVFNPAAAKARHQTFRVQDAFGKRPEFETLVTSDGSTVAEQVAGRELAGFDGVIAAGSDGTVFRVLNGFTDMQRETKDPGRDSDRHGQCFARELGLLPGQWKSG